MTRKEMFNAILNINDVAEALNNYDADNTEVYNTYLYALIMRVVMDFMPQDEDGFVYGSPEIASDFMIWLLDQKVIECNAYEAGSYRREAKKARKYYD